MQKSDRENSWIFRILVIFSFTMVYAVVFYFLYDKTRNGVVTNVNLIPIFLVSWMWGAKAGLLVTFTNTLVCTGIIIRFITPDAPLGVEGLQGIIVHFFFALVIGSFSSLNRNLVHQINEWEKAEKHLREYKDHLEEKVKRRTLELQKVNERLHQAEKMEAIGQLAGGIAHDFNNQLTIVLGYTEILQKRFREDSQVKYFLQQIHESGKKASDLTKQLLAFARKGIYTMQTVDLNKISTEIKSLLLRGIDKNITIVTSLNAATPYVWGGATQLQSAILNLALNACEAMKDGGTLTIKTDNIRIDQQYCLCHSLNIKHGDYVFISVSDTGTGMDEEVKKHLFEPFFTTKTETKGSGMGLAAVYGIVKSHKGAILVESEPQKGSTFTILLPQTSKIITCPDTKSVVSVSLDANLSVLVIDDEKEVAATIKEMLSDSAFDVKLAYDGKEGIEIYSRWWQSIDLVILDMVMPDLDGLQTFNALKEINPAIKAIILSGYTLNQKIEQALENGARIFLQKPCTKNELLSHIKFAMDQKENISTQ